MNTDFRMSKTWCAIFNADSSKPKLSKMEQSFLVQWLWILCVILSNTNENVLRNCDKIPNSCQHVSSCITVLAEMEEFWMCLWYVLESYGSSLTKHQKWNWQTSSECIRICKISLTDYLVFFFLTLWNAINVFQKKVANLHSCWHDWNCHIIHQFSN